MLHSETKTRPYVTVVSILDWKFWCGWALVYHFPQMVLVRLVSTRRGFFRRFCRSQMVLREAISTITITEVPSDTKCDMNTHRSQTGLSRITAESTWIYVIVSMWVKLVGKPWKCGRGTSLTLGSLNDFIRLEKCLMYLNWCVILEITRHFFV